VANSLLATLATFEDAPVNDDRWLIRVSEVRPRPQAWLWEGRIPVGSLTLLEGDPGQCKSAITYDLTARVTTGRPMPRCDGAATPAGVVLLQGEDDLAAVVRPRLEAAGADLSRVIAFDKAGSVGRPFVLPDDLPLIEKAAAAVQAHLLVIDPLTAFVRGSLSSDQGARQALGPLAAFAERTGVAALLVRHLTKATSANPLYRGAGTVGIIAAARAGLLAAADPAHEGPHRHVLVQTKASLAVAEGLAYRTVQAAGGIVIEWLGPTACTARDLAGAGGGEPSVLADAAWVLYSLLSDGPVAASEAIKLAAQAGVVKRTLCRAKKALRVVSRKEGSGRGSRWAWELPDDEALLRPYRERDRAERLHLVRRELAGRQPGDPWQPPARDPELYRSVLAERGLVVVRALGRDRLWREADVSRVPLLEELARASGEGDAAAAAAFRDHLAELGISPDRLGDS
jgi:hypothetical protein